MVRLAALSLLLSVLLPALGACGDDDGPVEPPIVVGPYLGSVELTEDTRTRLPDPQASIAPSDEPRFYWFNARAGGETLTFEVRAETTALEHGSLIHREQVQASAQGVPQGVLRLDPTALSRGGARRGTGGKLEWLPGVYSVKAFLGSGTESFATAIFEVR